MMKLVVLVALAAAVFATWNGQIEDVPGVAPQNMEKLREILTSRPNNKEEFKNKMEMWLNGLTEPEKAAAYKFREEMQAHQEGGQPVVSPSK
ncbi:unnamed protein product [Cylicocyclus nassatus]|uniref:Uncharacterized protein n=1 Tax=Cylicocyclus nassatus TaxID=53992 RepID=A0AA36DRV9_CYLNA|nr:unnamed protein product [Cylicocyclus nassatus]